MEDCLIVLRAYEQFQRLDVTGWIEYAKGLGLSSASVYRLITQGRVIRAIAEAARLQESDVHISGRAAQRINKDLSDVTQLVAKACRSTAYDRRATSVEQTLRQWLDERSGLPSIDPEQRRRALALMQQLVDRAEAASGGVARRARAGVSDV